MHMYWFLNFLSLCSFSHNAECFDAKHLINVTFFISDLMQFVGHQDVDHAYVECFVLISLQILSSLMMDATLP